MSLRIVKLGGSLLDLPGVAERLRTWLAGQPAATTLLVAGGGLLADAIRQAQRVHGFDDAAAHRLCLDAMAVTAALACELLPEATLIRRTGELDVAASGGLLVVDVREFLVAAADPLPESWSVTSDSIAAHVAFFLEAEELVLLKSTLPRTELPNLPVSPAALAVQGIVDDYFPRAVEAFLKCTSHKWCIPPNTDPTPPALKRRYPRGRQAEEPSLARRVSLGDGHAAVTGALVRGGARVRLVNLRDAQFAEVTISEATAAEMTPQKCNAQTLG